PQNHIMAGRIAIVIALIGGAWLAISSEYDSLRLFIWALALCASSLFPVLILSIWWKRCNAAGAIAGLLVGFTVAAGYIYLADIMGAQLWLGVDPSVAALFGAPAAAFCAVAISLLTPEPSKSVSDLAEEMMSPGGEAIFDRQRRATARRGTL
ncbi:MAG: sodium:solute symporter family transporter, partial [Methyloligellaceae bacterium]